MNAPRAAARRPLLTAAWLASVLAVPAPANPVPSPPPPPGVHALFVGIDHYRYSREHLPGAEFSDLSGPVGDVGRIKAALAGAYGLALDAPDAGACRSENAVSITLTDDCATHDAVLGALKQQLQAASAADTVVFYFAGHGSKVPDAQTFDKASGFHDTLLPADARDPKSPADADIYDDELDALIRGANARGVHVLTIFDACSSATATRDFDVGVHSRSAPPLTVARQTRAAVAAPAASAGVAAGYRAHLAAALDGEDAEETAGAGVFTTALVATLGDGAHRTYADLAAEVRLKVEEAGYPNQHPFAEGSLEATFGGPVARVVLIEGSAADGAVALDAGTLSGITEGSTFDLFGSTSDAVGASAPLAGARVSTVTTDGALLELDAPATDPLPRRIVAREKAHAFGRSVLAVVNRAPAGRDAAAVAAALATETAVRLSDATGATPTDGLIVARIPAQPGLSVLNADGSLLANLGEPGVPGFAASLQDLVHKVARAQALYALRTPVETAQLGFCIAPGSYLPDTCPAVLRHGDFALDPSEAAQVSVINQSDSKRYVYVFAVGPDYAVQLVLPPHGAQDPPLGASRPLQRGIKSFGKPGRYHFVTVSTDQPLQAAALEQDGVATRDADACASPLERLLCAAATGTRDIGAPRVGYWTATVNTVVVR